MLDFLRDLLSIYEKDLCRLMGHEKSLIKKGVREFNLTSNRDNWYLSLKRDEDIQELTRRLNFIQDICKNIDNNFTIDWGSLQKSLRNDFIFPSHRKLNGNKQAIRICVDGTIRGDHSITTCLSCKAAYRRRYRARRQGEGPQFDKLTSV